MENKIFCRTNIIDKNKEKIEIYKESRSKLQPKIKELEKQLKNKKRITNVLNALILLCFSLAYQNETNSFFTNLLNFNKIVMIICPPILIVNTAKYFSNTKEIKNEQNDYLEKIKFFNDEIKKLNIMNSELENGIKEIKTSNICEKEITKKLIFKKKN